MMSGVVVSGARLVAQRYRGAAAAVAAAAAAAAGCSARGLLLHNRNCRARLSTARKSVDGLTKRAIDGRGKMHAPFGRYSHAIKVEVAEAGPEAPALLVSSGQLATDVGGSIPSGCAAQVRQAKRPQLGYRALCAFLKICLLLRKVFAWGQAELIFHNLATLLHEAGLQREHIVHLRAYVTSREHFVDYMKARDDFLSHVAVKPVSYTRLWFGTDVFLAHLALVPLAVSSFQVLPDLALSPCSWTHRCSV